MVFALGPAAERHGYRLISFDSIGSTNAEALERARGGEAGPVWLVTAHQTAGRGRRSRTWVSPPGNLAATVLEAMPIQSAAAATLGFAAGLSLHRALDDLGIAAQLKWPNDVLLGGAKLSGIGLEAEAVGEGRLAVAVGIGVNVVSHPEGVPYAATSLAATGHEVTAEALFAALSERWAEYRAIWDLGRGMDKLRQAWLSRAAGIGGPVSVVLNGRTVAGTFETIDNEGHLIVLTADGRRVPIASGDVFFGDAASSRPAGAA